jgi:hypothetical protein
VFCGLPTGAEAPKADRTYQGARANDEERGQTRLPILPSAVRTVLQRLFPYFTRLHGKIFLWFYLVFAILTLLVLLAGSLSGHGDSLGRSVAVSIGAVSGPFTEAIARGFQSCCWRFSLNAFPFSGAVFGGGHLFQLVPRPLRRMERPIRISMWCVLSP